jgi:asparagine synthase (glutamine-hydrolysing)
MPGISVYYKHNPKAEFDISIDDLRHENDYNIETLYKSDNVCFIFSGYDSYPIQYNNGDIFFTCIEGLIYNKTTKQINNDLQKIVNLPINSDKQKKAINNFIKTSDGDYSVYIYSKTSNQLTIFGDLWGRLKSYYYHDNNIALISRENIFIINNIPVIQFNKTALTEFIVLEYTLGNKTIISKVYKTPPSFMIYISSDVNNINLDAKQMVKHDFTTHQNYSKGETIDKCANIYLESLEQISKKLHKENYKFSADLSGGYDSRAIFFGLAKQNINVEYYTDFLLTGDESLFAKNVADTYKQKLTIIKANHDINIKDLSELTYKTGCNVNAITALSCYQDAYERKRTTNINFVKFQGFGGEFIRHPYTRVKGYHTLTSMLNNDIHIHGISVNDACEVLKIASTTFIDQLKNHENNYSEIEIDDKIKHLYFEYYNNLVNMGEERARLHFWTVQPLLSSKLQSFYLHEIPRKYINTKYFIEFLRKIDPKSLTIPIYGSKINLNSKLSVQLNMIKQSIDSLIRYNKFFRSLAKRIKQIFNKQNKSKYTDDYLISEAMKCFDNSKFLSNNIDKLTVQNLFENKSSFYNIKPLMTVILYINALEKNHANKMI